MEPPGSSTLLNRTFCVSGGWKCIAVISILSCILLIGVYRWTLSFPQIGPGKLCPNETWAPFTKRERLVKFWTLTAVMLPVAILASTLLLPKVQVDNRGVSVRRLLRWRRFSWERLRKGYNRELCVGHTLPYSPEIRIHFYKIWILLSDADRLQIEQILVPEGTCTHFGDIACQFHLQLDSSQGQLEVGPDGLTWIQKNETTCFLWEEVTQLRTRTETRDWAGPARIEFRVAGRSLNAFIRNQPIEPDKPCDCPPEYRLMRFLRSKIDPGRIVEFANHGEPKSVEEAEWRLKDLRMVVWFLSIMSVLLIPAWIFMVVTTGDFAQGWMWAILSRSGAFGIMSLTVFAMPFIFHRISGKPLTDYITEQRKAPEQTPGESSI